MKTFYTIFGGKLIRWILLGVTLSLFSQIYSQPCSNPPVMSLSGDATICQGQVTNIYFNITGGVRPWRLTYSINGVPQPEVTNIMVSPFVLTTGTAGQYTGISIYDFDNCAGSVTGSAVTVDVNSPPTSFAGNNAIVCPGSSYMLTQSSATNYSSLLWATSGDGTFDNPNTLHPIYTPGAYDQLNGGATLTLNAIGIIPCGPSISSMFLEIVDQPIANAGPDKNVCENSQVSLNATAVNYSSIYWTTSGSGVFTNPMALNTNYILGPSDIDNGSVVLTLHATGVGSCGFTATDNLTVNITQRPVAVAGPNIFSCGYGPVQLNGFAENYSSVVWTATGNGTFLDPNSLNTIYYPGQSNISSGSAVLTLTVYAQYPCTGNVTSELTITLGASATVSAGPDAVTCGTASYQITGASATKYSAIEWTTSGTGVFMNPTSLTPTYFPSAADLSNGSVTLTVAAYGLDECASQAVTDEMVIYLTKEPTANAGSPALVCEGSSLQINDASATSFSTVNWTTSGTGSFANNGTLSPTYTPSAADIAAGSVQLTLTAYPLAPCSSPATSTKILTFSPIPDVYAGADGTVCNDSPYSITDAHANNFSSVIWSSSGTGTFSSPTSINTNYVPSNSDVIAGSVILTLTAYGDPACNLSASDQLTLTIVKSPVVNAGINGNTCEGTIFTVMNASASNYSTITWTTNGTGVLSNANSLNPSYIPSHSDALVGSVTLTITAKGNGPCVGTVSDAMVLTVTPLPTVNAGNDLSVCGTDPVSISAAFAQNYTTVFWSTSGSGTFTNPTSLATTYIPSAADVADGSVILTLTAAPLSPCATSVSDNLTLNLTALPVANAGPDYISCTGTFLITAATASNYSSVSWSTNGTGVLLNPNTLTSSYTASAQDIINGSVNLILTVQGQAPCNMQVTDFMVLTLPGVPTANAGIDASICEGSVYQVTTATASNYGSIYWTTSGSGTFSGQNTLTPVYTPSIPDIANGSVTLTMIATAPAPCSNTVSDQMLLTIAKNPIAYAGPDLNICENGSAQITGSANNSLTFIWNTSGDGTFANNSTLTPTYFPGSGDIANGSVTITLTAYALSPCTVSANDDMIITIGTEPMVDAGSDQLICGNFYTLVNAAATDYATLSWTTSGTGVFINGNSANATYLASPTDLAAGSVTLTLTATGLFPCSSTVSDQMVLTFTPVPTAYAGPDGSTCGSNSYTLVDATVTNYSGINWTTSGTGTFSNPSDINPTYFPSAADYVAGYVTLTLSVTGYNICNLTATDQMVLSFNTQPIINAGPDISSCDTDPVQITGATATNYTTINWTHNGSGLLQNATGLMPVYIPSQSDVIAGQVTLTLHAMPLLPCTNEVTDVMIINLQSGPTVSAGGDIEICTTANVTLNAATASNYVSILWTTSGSGTFSNSAAINPIYFPSAEDIASGSVNLTLTATGSAPCNIKESDFMVLTISHGPTVDAGPDGVFCGPTYQLTQVNAQNYESLVWTTSGTGTFTDPNVLNTVYTPSNNDILSGSVTLTLTVQGNPPCSIQASDNMILTIPPTVVANAGNDASTCGATPYTVSTATATPGSTILWTSSGTGTFVNQNTINPTYTPSAADVASGSVLLTMQIQGAAPCYTNAQDDMLLTFSSGATAYAGPDTQICEGTNFTVSGASATNYAALNWTSSGSGSFIGNNTLTPTYQPSANDYLNGSVVLTLTAVSQSPCSNSVTDDMLLTFMKPVVANAGPDDIVCFGSGYTVSGASAAGAVSINWTTSGSGTFINTNTLSPTYYPSAADKIAGTVTLTLTVGSASPCLNTSSDIMLLTIDAAPTDLPIITGPQSLCAGETGVQYSIVNPIQYATGYDWILPSGATIVSGSGTSSIIVDFGFNSFSGSIFCTPISNCGNGPTGNYPISVSSPGNITIIASGPVDFCYGQSVTLSAPSGFQSYLWSTGETTQSIEVTTNGDYFVIVTDDSGCLSAPSNTITVTVGSGIPAPEITANGPTDICPGSSVTLMAPSGYATYTWSNGATTQNINVSTPGDHYVVVTDFNGCSSYPSNIITVKQIPSPTISAGLDDAVCAGSNYIMASASASGYTSLQWSSSGTGSWLNANTLNPTYIPSVSDINNGTVTLTLTANNQNCSVSDDMILSIVESISVYAGADGITCDGALYQIVGATATSYNTLLWTTSGTGTFNDPTILNPIYTPSPADIATGLVQLSLTGTALSPCTGTDSDAMTLVIKKQPMVNAGSDGTICQGQQYVITDATAMNYNTLTWITSGSGYFINGTTLNPTYVPGAFDLSAGSVILSLVASNSPCGDIMDSQTLTITPPATAEAGPDATICETCSYTVSGAYVTNSMNYVWTTTGTGTLTGANTLTPTYQPSVQDITNGSVTLILTAESFNGCGSISDQMTIFINQGIMIDYTWDGICELSQTNFSVLETMVPITSIAIWNWDFGDGFYSNVMNPSHTFPTVGQYYVKLTVTDTAGSVFSITHLIEIQSTPNAFFGIETPNCQGHTTQFLDYSSTENGYLTTWVWDFGDGSPAQTVNFPDNPNLTHYYAAQGTYDVTLKVINSFGCENTYKTQVSVTPAPIANFQFSASCEDMVVNFSDASNPNAPGSIVSWNWNFGDPGSGTFNTSTMANPQHIYANPGVYNVELIVVNVNNCSDTIVKQVITGEAPPVAFTWEASCANALTNFFIDPTIVNINTITNFLWDFGDGGQSTLQDPQHLYTETGQYTVMLTITDTAGCMNTVSNLITVSDGPLAYFSYSEPTCNLEEVLFTDLSSSPSGYISEWLWEFGDGQTTTVQYPASPNVSHVFPGPATFNVALTVTTTAGCEHSVIRTITILPDPVANFSYSTSCLSDPVIFNDLSQGNGADQITNWSWNFGDPASGTSNTSSLQNPTHIYSQAGTYTVQLIITTTNGCMNEVSKVLVVSPLPFVDFTSTLGCASDTVSFTSSNFVNIPNTMGWLWNFGDGSTSTDIDPIHVYAVAGTYNVTLTITDKSGCTNTISHPTEVIAGPVAMFTYSAPSCSGSEVLFTDMSAAVGSNLTTWHWDFGDGTSQTVTLPSSPNVTHVYATSGIYTVTLTVTNLTGCEGSTTNYVNILPKPVANFSYAAGCMGAPVQFTDNTTTNGGSPIIQWYWNFGDPASGASNTSNLQNPLHPFTGSGTYSVLLVSTSTAGCQDSIIQQVTISAPPIVTFTYSMGCAGSPVTFNPDPNLISSGNIASWLWDFGDGTGVSGAMSPSHSFSSHGNYMVTLTVTTVDGCIGVGSQSVYVAAIPVATFTAASTCIGTETQFIDHSYSPTGEPIVAWNWIFGDPGSGSSNTSTMQNPTHTYNNPGHYNVSLTVTSTSGCISATQIPIEVLPAPVAAFSYIANACVDGSVTFQDQSTSNLGGLTNWRWQFEPSYYSNLQNPQHTFSASDTCFNVQLIVTDMLGCIDTTVQQVCVPAGLDVAIEHTPTCKGEITYFTPVLISPVGGSLKSYLWNFDDIQSGVNNTSTLANPSHYYEKTGNYLVTLTATDINNCLITVYSNILVEALPLPNFSYSVGNCDSTIYFTDLSLANGNGIVKWIWDYGDGSIDTINDVSVNPSHYYAKTGIFTVTLTTITGSGCSNSYSTTIEKTPCLIAGFTKIGGTVCERSSATFADQSQCGNPIDNWVWYFGDGSSTEYTAYQPTISHYYENDGSYQVSLVVSTTVAGITTRDTITQSIVVVTAPDANFTNSNICVNAQTQFIDQTQWGNSGERKYNWDFGDAQAVSDTDTSQNPVFKYVLPGDYTTTLIVTNEFGCSDTISKLLTAHKPPVSSFELGLACQNYRTYFTDMSYSPDTTINHWWWRFRDSVNILGLAGVQDAYFTFKDTGVYNVELIVMDGNGCTDTSSSNVIVNPTPVASFEITENYENTQGRVLFTNTSVGGKEYEWDFDSGIPEFKINPVVDFPGDGEYDITLIAYNEFNCPDTMTKKYKLMYKGLWIPNAFSPNNPNEQVRLFKPIGVNLKSYMIEVYDTWGNVLWTSSTLDENGSPAEGWNGFYNNKLLPQDTYLWKATGVFIDGTIWEGKSVGNTENIPQYSYGTVYLIR